MLSICIFGSQARRTADPISDRDVLLVGKSSSALDRELAGWTARNWNVSVFDPAAFERMADVKALFLQHLKQEGQIVHDDGGFVGAVLGRYSPKADYSAERNDALAQIISLPSTTSCYWHDLCLADIVYVLFRNASILHLACAGDYCFQYDELVMQMANLFCLDRKDRAALLQLRSLKHGYRRRVEGLAARPTLNEACQAVKRLTERMPDTSHSSISAGITTDDYFRLRLKELDLVAANHPAALDMLEPDSTFFTLWQRIRFGCGYPKLDIQLH